MNGPFISICIPAYKRVRFLVRLLDSLIVQTYTNFEIIVTDDSDDDSVSEMINAYRQRLPIAYYKNETALGTPANWNYAVSKAKGEWIKIMHDDDWFSTEDSLAFFSTAVRENPAERFFFCAYANISEPNKSKTEVHLSKWRFRAMRNDPVTLLAANIIGPPSVTLYRNDGKHSYDANVKWVVDIDFYIRYFQDRPPFYITKVLVNVGISDTQVTSYTFGVPDVHLKESLYLLNKTGEKHLKNILVFDAWWRLIRNFKIKEARQMDFGPELKIPQVIRSIIDAQKKIPEKVLHTGVLSKCFMTLYFMRIRHEVNGNA